MVKGEWCYHGHLVCVLCRPAPSLHSSDSGIIFYYLFVSFFEQTYFKVANIFTIYNNLFLWRENLSKILVILNVYICWKFNSKGKWQPTGILNL